MNRCFEDFQEGETQNSLGRTITETDVVNFAALSGDWNELHVNEEYARAGYFGRRIAHGALIFSISTGLGAQTPISGHADLVAFYGVDRLRFIKPTFLGDTIRLKESVQSLEVRDEETGIVNILREVLNQEGAVVQAYVAKFLVRRRVAPKKPTRKK